MGARMDEYCDTTLLPSEVVAFWINASRSERSTGMAFSSRMAHAFSPAMFIASEMTVGWMPFSINSMLFFNRAPANTTTDVVPSPALMSCAVNVGRSALRFASRSVHVWMDCTHLCFGKLHKHLRSWMRHLHLLEHGRTIVGDQHFAVGLFHLRENASERPSVRLLEASLAPLVHLSALFFFSCASAVRSYALARCQSTILRTILSMPRGPKLVRTASATALAASRLSHRTSFLRLSLR